MGAISGDPYKNMQAYLRGERVMASQKANDAANVPLQEMDSKLKTYAAKKTVGATPDLTDTAVRAAGKEAALRLLQTSGSRSSSFTTGPDGVQSVGRAPSLLGGAAGSPGEWQPTATLKPKKTLLGGFG